MSISSGILYIFPRLEIFRDLSSVEAFFFPQWKRSGRGLDRSSGRLFFFFTCGLSFTCWCCCSGKARGSTAKPLQSAVDFLRIRTSTAQFLLFFKKKEFQRKFPRPWIGPGVCQCHVVRAFLKKKFKISFQKLQKFICVDWAIFWKQFLVDPPDLLTGKWQRWEAFTSHFGQFCKFLVVFVLEQSLSYSPFCCHSNCKELVSERIEFHSK